MVGKYKNVEGKDGSIIKRDPYYLKVAVSDTNQSLDNVRIESIRLFENNRRTINVLLEPKIVKFKGSQLHDGLNASFVANDIILSDENYSLNISLIICGKNDKCETKELTGEFLLEVTKYSNSILIDRILSI